MSIAIQPKDYIKEAKDLKILLQRNRNEEKAKMISPDSIDPKDGNNICFVYLVSIKWLQLWKKKTSFAKLEQGYDLYPEDIQDFEIIRLNSDLIDFSAMNESFLQTENQQLSFLNIPAISPLVDTENVTIVDEMTWEYIKSCYPDAIEIKRPLYVMPNEVRYELNLIPLEIMFLTKAMAREHDPKKNELLKLYKFQVSKRMSPNDLKEFVLELIEKVIPRKFTHYTFSASKIGIFVIDGDKTIEDFMKALEEAKQISAQLYSTKVHFPGIMLLGEGEPLENHEEYIFPGATLVIEYKDYSFMLSTPNQLDCEGCNSTILGQPIKCECGKVAYCDDDCMTRDERFHSSKCTKPEQVERNENSRCGSVGLRNLGNTCYMNSGLQCLSHTDELTEYFISKAYEDEINTDNPLGTSGKLVDAFSKLIIQMWNGSGPVVAPSKFKHELSKAFSMFDGYGQHDSQEFISHLLDGLHEDLNLIHKKPYTEGVEWKKGQTDLQVARESWRVFLQRNCSKIVELFYGQFKSELRCPTCNSLNITFDPFQVISLPLQNSYTEKFSTFSLPENHSKAIQKHSLIVKMSNSGCTVQLLIDAYAETVRCKPESIVFAFVGFSLIGHLIESNENLKDVVQRLNDPQFKMKLFILHLNEQEQLIRKSPDLITIYAQICRNEGGKKRYPTMNRYAFVTRNNTIKDVYFEIFKKLAHFHKYPDGEDNSIHFQNDNPIPKVNYERLFNEYFCKDQYRFFDLVLEGEDEVISIDSPQSIVECIRRSQYANNQIVFEVHLTNNVEDWLELLVMNKSTPVNTPITLSSTHSQNTLSGLLQSFTTAEQLDSNNTWYCKSCKDHVKAFKHLQVYKLPKYLILHMKKLKSGVQSSIIGPLYTQPQHLFIDFPLEGLNMSPFVLNRDSIDSYGIGVEEYGDKGNERIIRKKKGLHTDPNQASSPLDSSCMYDCYGVVNHYGSNFFGHYTAFVKREDGWYCGDDSSFSKIDEKKVVSEAAYVLFYKRRD